MPACCWAAEEGIPDFDATTSESKTIVRTEADVEQGQRNVQSVYEQLEALLTPASLDKKILKQRENVQPYLKVIPNADGTDLQEATSTLIYQCRFTDAAELAKSVESLVDNGYVESNPSQNMLVLKEKSSRINEIKEAVLAMDIPAPQVLVEAKVVEILFNDGMQRNLGVMFNQAKEGETGTGSPTDLNSSLGASTSVLGSNAPNQGAMMDWYPYVNGKENIKLSFQWLLNAQDAKILSSPNIVVSRNQDATINTGQDIPIQTLQTTASGNQVATTFKNVGVTLKVEPKLIDGNTVSLVIYPQVSNVLQYQKVTQGTDASGNAMSFQVPVISVRSVKTELTMESGQVVMMGGLYSNREVLMQERIPFLSDVPYIGELFTSKSRTKEIVQLVFVLRVHIIQPDETVAGILFDPDALAAESESIGKMLQGPPTFPVIQSTIEQVDDEFIKNPTTEAE
ncbi:type II secretion system protein GspD [Victivallis sp. Marseille-Q1083]|uniref:type II secretion system protein GspD n=1 Tax=Victivallis sp. Marseille-Q1083 TaxID=2717288 RepID=UPI00158A6366|nr:hypothetical protein [Victivallis sp. Marseille-Q1083]